MKKFLFYLGHPAHFHLFKNIIALLEENGHKIIIAIKTKDVLEKLLQNAGLQYHNLLPKRRGKSKPSIIINEIKKNKALLTLCRKHKPDLLIGTSSATPLVGKLLGIPSFNVCEDDAEVIPYYAKFTYPLSSEIITPLTCNNGRWDKKSIKYNGYHELAYLHPTSFHPNKEVVNKYIPLDKPYFLMRFSGLDAHHDQGIEGINVEFAEQIIQHIKQKGNVYISSERPLPSKLDQHRIHIDPLDIHHIICFAEMFIGDSQTMAAEAGVLGTPFIRYNSFVGRIGYLNDIENNYKLGFGIKTENKEEMLSVLQSLLSQTSLKQQFEERRNKMLQDKIDVNQFFVWLIENYPESKIILRKDPDYQNRFIND